jgi:antitoxin (DNA-binding transcriptional repressor) of toxin-antitoxin stability system
VAPLGLLSIRFDSCTQIEYTLEMVMAQAGGEKTVRVGVRELRANLSSILRQARRGTSILVMSRNEVVAEIRPPSRAEHPRRVPGALKGKIRIAPNFDKTPDDLIDAMEG